jgi:hypothetical protein
VGLCLNEVGNLSDLFRKTDKELFDNLIQEAFQDAGAAEHGPAQIFWGDGETVAAWRHEQEVNKLSQLKKLPHVSTWRTLDRFEVTGATEHGPASLLVYNNHQPASAVRKFPVPMRIRLCREVLKDAIRNHSNTPENIGFEFGGDANCNLTHWQAALVEESHYTLHFNEAQMLWGKNQKPGDLMVAAGINGFQVIEEKCDVPNRDRQHDSMIFRWCYRAQPPRESHPSPWGAYAQHTRATGHADREDDLSSIQESSHMKELLEPDPPSEVDEPSERGDEPEADYDNPSEAADTPSEGDGDGNEHSDVASEHIDREEHREKHFDDLTAMGFALATSASLLRAFNTRTGPKNCLDVALVKKMEGTCSDADRQALEQAVQLFFC